MLTSANISVCNTPKTYDIDIGYFFQDTRRITLSKNGNLSTLLFSVDLLHQLPQKREKNAKIGLFFFQEFLWETYDR